MTDTIRILICDDHAIVRKGLRTLIDSEPGMEVIGEAANGREAVLKVQSLQPDVILMDLVMPRMGGVEAIIEIKKDFPEARLLVITSFAEEEKVFAAIKAGALGYLLKDSSPEQLVQAIHDVHRGESSLHPTIALKLIREISQPADLPPTDDPLTERELEVLKLVALGSTNQEIAAALFISERTVGNHIGNILSKLHLANRTQAALYALRKGLASLDAD
ncbi:MAG: response regulator transcription factor [Chloroflexi bacterium]|nr:response regulator transcription factor [Chloroflexota bacterium]